MLRLLFASLFVLPLLAACSDDKPANVFEAQTQAVDKAEDAVKALEGAAAAQRKAIETQSQ